MRIVVVIAALLLLSQTTNPAREGPDQTPFRITGRVVAVSDVATIPDLPLAKAMVVAVPADAFPALLAESAPLAAPTGELAFTAFRLECDGHERHEAPAAADGRYELALPPGEYVLCLANVRGRKAERPPFEVAGCVKVAGRPGQDVRLDIGFGEGGVTALPDRAPKRDRPE